MADSEGIQTVESIRLDPRSSWIVVAAGFILVLILYGAYYSFGVFLKPMLDDLGWSTAVTTGATSVYLVVHGALAILMGHLSDKYGPRWVVTGGTLLIVVGYLLISQVSAPWHLYMCFGILVGIGMGAAYVPPLATVTKWFIIRRGLALGIVAAGVGVGQIVLPPLLKYVITDYGWRDSFTLLGIMTFVIGTPAALLLKNPPLGFLANSNEIGGELQKNWSVRQALKAPPFWLLLAVFAGLVFGTNIVMTHLVAHIEYHGIDPVPAAITVTLIGISGIVGRIISGGGADRFGSRIMAAICLALQVLVFALLIWVGRLWGFYLVGVLYGIGYGGTLPLVIKMSSEFFGTDSAGAIFGILLFGASIAGAIGVPLAGYIYDVTDDYAIAFMIATIVVAVAFIFNIFLKPPSENGQR